MVSKHSDGGVVDAFLQEKVMVSGRVPRYITKYAKDRKITISELIEAGFDRYREQDVAHASERLKYHEECVLHWKGIVLQNEQECNTKLHICNTIKQEFKEQGRGTKQTKRQDLYWLEPRVKNLVDQGIIISLNELYKYCVSEEI